MERPLITTPPTGLLNLFLADLVHLLRLGEHKARKQVIHFNNKKKPDHGDHVFSVGGRQKEGVSR